MDVSSPNKSVFNQAVEPSCSKPDLVPTMTNVTMTPEMFEKIYLTVKTPRAGDNLKRFANPTPLGFVGFVISSMTFSMILMGWGGAQGTSALAGMFLFVGPVLLILTVIFEFILGNFFAMMVCGLFAVFWLSFSLLQFPSLNLAGAYSTAGSAAEGAASRQYNAVLALYLLVWGFALLTFAIFTIKTNAVFVSMFISATAATFVLSAAYWKVSIGDYRLANDLQKAGGALFFVTGLFGWYMTVVIMAAEMRMTYSLPVGDLSHYWSKTDVEMATASERS